MKIDKIKIYAFEIILLVFLFFALFVSSMSTRIVISIFLTMYMIIAKKMMKKRSIVSMYKKQVTILMTAFAIIYLLAFYAMGLYFGFYNATVKLSLWSLKMYIIPLIVIIISTEIIRRVLVSQNAKLSRTLSFISLVLIDVIVYKGVYNITELDGFLSIVGFIIFASVSCNLLYNYIAERFGCIPVISYKLITILYAYMIPIIPNVYIFFRSFLRMLYPYMIYLVLEYSYAKTTFAIAYKDRTKKMISTTIIVVLMSLLIMLISCQFRFGILVIGSGSMTGTINKGDAVVFESYHGQKITEGQIIIFERDNLKVVHRVIGIKTINGKKNYYTKGDANQQQDEGYVTEEKILGITKFKISYIGYPTLWLSDMFNK